MEFTNLPSTISKPIANKIVEVLNVFETARKEGRYDAVSTYKDFHYKSNKYYQITYGRSQTTEFGNLKRLLEIYADNNGTFKAKFSRYLNKIGKITKDVPQSLWQDSTFKNLLRESAKNDPIMRSTQDLFFERYYFQPALGFFRQHNFTLPLSLLVIYDSYVHSGSIRPDLRQRFPEMPPSMGGNEKKWIEQYTDVRFDWLANHSTLLLRKTVYRPETFRALIRDNNWGLTKPFTTQGVSF